MMGILGLPVRRVVLESVRDCFSRVARVSGRTAFGYGARRQCGAAGAGGPVGSRILAGPGSGESSPGAYCLSVRVTVIGCQNGRSNGSAGYLTTRPSDAVPPGVPADGQSVIGAAGTE